MTDSRIFLCICWIILCKVGLFLFSSIKWATFEREKKHSLKGSCLLTVQISNLFASLLLFFSPSLSSLSHLLYITLAFLRALSSIYILSASTPPLQHTPPSICDPPSPPPPLSVSLMKQLKVPLQLILSSRLTQESSSMQVCLSMSLQNGCVPAYMHGCEFRGLMREEGGGGLRIKITLLCSV